MSVQRTEFYYFFLTIIVNYINDLKTFQNWVTFSTSLKIIDSIHTFIDLSCHCYDTQLSLIILPKNLSLPKNSNSGL